MSHRFDIAGYRAAKRLAGIQPLTETLGRVIDALSSRENITLWQQGIEKFDPASGSEAFSHYEGFRRAMVDSAAEAATQASGEGRYAANDLEQALEPGRFSRYIRQITPQATDEDLRAFANTYLDGALRSVVEVRHRRTSGPTPS